MHQIYDNIHFTIWNTTHNKIFKSRSWPTFLGYDQIDIKSSNMDLKLAYE